jgi:hypothetical protein
MTHAKYILRVYGITGEQYAEMLKLSGGVCWICGRPPRRRRLSVDHDHRIGKGKPNSVRGLLCFKCNLGLQRFGDNPDHLRRAADYLERKLAFLQKGSDDKDKA